jgi:hypothetical protein
MEVPGGGRRAGPTSPPARREATFAAVGRGAGAERRSDSDRWTRPRVGRRHCDQTRLRSKIVLFCFPIYSTI